MCGDDCRDLPFAAIKVRKHTTAWPKRLQRPKELRQNTREVGKIEKPSVAFRISRMPSVSGHHNDDR